ncbi:MAG: N-acetylmuramoyl-L-alanine amidase [Pseudomonadales bacterium]|nr:N-acetylmuramoyl-L-alanine amidase [Pseudomonadales bacterium]
MRANDLKNRCSKLAVTIVFFKAIIFAMAGGMPLFVASAFAAPTSIESVRVRQSPERTRIVFDLSQPVKHRIFSLANPRRLVIDIEETDLAVDISDVLIEGTPITGLRTAIRENKDLRVVLDLSKYVKPSSFVLSPILQYGDRLVVDLYTEEQQVAPVIQKADQISRQMRDVVIAIDAGHGGDDPGAIGPGKLYEKTVVMAIAKKLKIYFEREQGYKVVLIRTGDYYVGLKKRTQLAYQSRADVFLSIHADSFKSPNASGASVYAISQRGATSEAARRVAEKENRADLIGGAGIISMDDKDDLLAGVLLDLAMDASLDASVEMGKNVLNEIKPINKLHKTSVEQAAFAVLKSPDIPSLLIETGFITNPAESKKLKSAKHQDRIARAIFTGVNQYMKTKPPEGSYFAWKRRGGASQLSTYKIVRGDTLSGIADKYRVSTKKIMSVNGLDNANIRIGQVLKIPSI